MSDEIVEVTLTLKVRFKTKRQWYPEDGGLETIAKLEAHSFLNYPRECLDLSTTEVVEYIAEVEGEENGKRSRAMYRLPESK